MSDGSFGSSSRASTTLAVPLGGMGTRPPGVLVFWHATKRQVSALARFNPVWVVLETTGRRSGLPRQVPLALGPMSGPDEMTFISVHGTSADWVKNLLANPQVRLRIWWRWRSGHATVTPYDPESMRQFNWYGKLGAKIFVIDSFTPVLVKVKFTPA
ncbi:nitroreductase family deazaflavin-dependent oxidoreductase [Nocardia puris]|uniref:nitroreductase family deazaflavin-dependent oxidoreductase n=1 Tax=Nocardia puris TaxID=208602 RepID=UPI0018943CAB|nr:nitroreductase family deazaflavin-dependent oxidoreductase [Nocardia puris]MBF6215920.1 nitroreductase family deazaflavin-dependent oxidoreductase [Nocardia puris]MBF6370272.1 nitroreductase family deazaflavin-dependent oxidoreductase [Nocardia puris]